MSSMLPFQRNLAILVQVFFGVVVNGGAPLIITQQLFGMHWALHLI